VRTAAAVLLAAAFVVAMVYFTLSEGQVECEVCMEFGGRTACQTVAAVDRDRALAMAVSSACAVLTSGVTPGIQCGQTPPRSVSCDP
jgi:hypothetical protein